MLNKSILRKQQAGIITKEEANVEKAQLIVDTKVSKGAFIFKTKKFSSANFKFEQKGQVWKPFLSMMGIKMVK